MRGEFYSIDASWYSNQSEYVILNEERLIQSRPPHSSRHFAAIPWHPGFWPMSEKPVLQIKDKPRTTPKELDYCGGYWLLSDKCKSVFEKTDYLAFSFIECECCDPKGNKMRSRWLCDVVRVVDALDEEMTKVEIKTPGGWHKRYEIDVSSNLYFRKLAIPIDCHIFKMAHYHGMRIVDRYFRDILRNNVTNIRLIDVEARGRLYGIR